MPNFQQVTVVGHVGKDPELRNTNNGTAVANFSIAVTDNKGKDNEHTEWFNITAWKRTAEICAEYVKKGDPLMVVGRLKTDKWQDDSGADRYTVRLHANQIQLLKSKNGGTPTTKTTQGPAAQPAPTPEDFDDDIPF